MNMKTIMKKTNTKAPGAYFAAFAFLFAAVMLVVPAQAKAGSDYKDIVDYKSDTSDYSSDTSYYYPDYSSDTSYSYPEYSSDTSYSYPEYSSDTSSYYQYSTPSYSYYGNSGCGSSCGGSSYSTPTYHYATTPSCGSSCGSSYNYTPPTYHYNTQPACTTCGGGSSYVAPVYTYVPTNTNVNTNTANPANTNNNNSSATSSSTSSSVSTVGNVTSQSNPNINIVVYAGKGSNTTPTPTVQSLDGYCTINPNNVSVNQDVTLTANGTGGNGNYTYSWSGSDGLYSNSQTFTGRFSSYGSKTATVNIQSGNQSITRTCSVNVQTNQNINNNLSAYCTANPAVAAIGQAVTWTVYPTGGNNYNGNYNNNAYTYYWSGTDGLTGYGQTVNGTYSSAGTKTANVNVTSNGQTINVSCNMNVQGAVSAVTVIRQPTNGTPVSGVYLSQIPATGIDLNTKTIFFVLGLLAWSSFVAYIINTKRKAKLALAGISPDVAGFNASAMSKAEAFKMKNMSARGLVA